MRVIAIEEHFRTPALAAAAGAAWAMMPPAIEAKLADLGAGRLAEMDAGGIDLQVLSHALPLESLEPSTAVPLARQENDRLAQIVGQHPDRFRAFAMLPAMDPQSAADELARTVMEHGFKGALILGRPGGRFMDQSAFTPIWERAQELGVPIYLHPAPPSETIQREYYDGLAPEISRWLSMAAWGWHIETGLHALRLILSGTFDRFPRLQVIIGHMGETIPFMLDRITEWLPRRLTGLDREVRDYVLGNVYVTTSGFFTDPPLRCALDVLGSDRIIFSVDYPFSSNRAGRDFLDRAPLEPDDRERIAHANAERLLGL
jgi:predicted TIM-barrel fold metal-dependent hydrolase